MQKAVNIIFSLDDPEEKPMSKFHASLAILCIIKFCLKVDYEYYFHFINLKLETIEQNQRKNSIINCIQTQELTF